MIEMLLAPYCVGLGHVAEPDSVRVCSVRAAVESISKDLGRTVSVDQGLKDIPVLIKEQDATPKQKLDNLAFALHASLVRDSQTLRLERNAEDRRSIFSVHEGLVERSISAGLLRSAALLATTATNDSLPDQIRKSKARISEVLRAASEARLRKEPYTIPSNLVNPDALTPASRLTLALLQKIGATALARSLSPGVVFFSDRPNSVEHPLPDCRELLRTYVRQVDSLQGSSVASPGKIVLRVDRSGGVLRIFDDRGQQLDVGSVDYANRVLYVGGVPVTKPQKPNWIALDSSDIEMDAFLYPNDEQRIENYRRGYEGLLPKSSPPKGFVHPETRDPLDFAARRGVLSMLSGEKGRYVAVLPDWLIDLAHECVSDDKLDSNAFAEVLRKEGDIGRPALERVVRGSLIILRPVDMIDSESAVANRTNLGKSLRQVLSDGRIGIGNWPSVFLDLYSSRRSSVTKRYIEALREYGLPCAEQVVGQAPGPLALIAATAKMNHPQSQGNVSPLDRLLTDGILEGWLSVHSALGATDLASSPSSLIRNGLANVRVVKISGETPLADKQTDGNGPFVGLEPGRLGRDTLFPPGFPHTEADIRTRLDVKWFKARYRVGRRLTAGADIQFENCSPIRLEVSDVALDRVNLSFSELPKIFRDGVLDQVQKQLGENYKPTLLPGDRVTSP